LYGYEVFSEDFTVFCGVWMQTNNVEMVLLELELIFGNSTCAYRLCKQIMVYMTSMGWVAPWEGRKGPG
jgi:hypothetical protein